MPRPGDGLSRPAGGYIFAAQHRGSRPTLVWLSGRRQSRPPLLRVCRCPPPTPGRLDPCTPSRRVSLSAIQPLARMELDGAMYDVRRDGSGYGSLAPPRASRHTMHATTRNAGVVKTVIHFIPEVGSSAVPGIGSFAECTSPSLAKPRPGPGVAPARSGNAAFVARLVEAAVRNRAPARTVAAEAAALVQVFATSPAARGPTPSRRRPPPMNPKQMRGAGAATTALALLALPREAKRSRETPGETPPTTPAPAALEAPLRVPDRGALAPRPPRLRSEASDGFGPALIRTSRGSRLRRYHRLPCSVHRPHSLRRRRRHRLSPTPPKGRRRSSTAAGGWRSAVTVLLATAWHARHALGFNS